MISRRSLLLGAAGTAAIASTAKADSAIDAFLDSVGLDPATASRQGFRIDRQWLPQDVSYSGRERPGTIVIDVANRYLYHVQEGGSARRYGIGVGRDGFRWAGSAVVGRKAEWPTWTPPPAMIRRQPELREWAGGMPGGVDNPLGARALYLYRGGRDTLYRIHGTNAPWTIGQAMSSGCIRMVNEHVEELYDRVRVGSRVIVRQVAA
ncbi:MAG: L,D-transpeptidase [Rhizobiales bacterium]|nr:L,D-transpeptidase [Hyphomicrobiales bacterium]MBO6699045.1 L,D-transpeptidase [Hyphomicrobiales bacterium]MBO6736583.1 L,D-transpeptidase [Hyphomicrobiales bacterium]MBO6912343.1 L,D-transpeptidase [Hyphomicrobiales bacterium]MBO6956294.1 L,D-transpeptidase [Hyphomicrobiales bacterium]